MRGNGDDDDDGSSTLGRVVVCLAGCTTVDGWMDGRTGEPMVGSMMDWIGLDWLQRTTLPHTTTTITVTTLATAIPL